MPPDSHGPLGWIAQRGLEYQKRKQSALIKVETVYAKLLDEAPILSLELLKVDQCESSPCLKNRFESLRAEKSRADCMHCTTASIIVPESSVSRGLENETDRKQCSSYKKATSAGSCKSNPRSDTSRTQTLTIQDVDRVDCKLLPAIGMPSADYRRARAAERAAGSGRYDDTIDLFAQWSDGGAELCDDFYPGHSNDQYYHLAKVDLRIPRISFLPPIQLRAKLNINDPTGYDSL